MEYEIRKFVATDIQNIVSMYYGTVHSIRAQDYSSQQLEAWAPKEEKESIISKWANSFRKNISYVAEIDSKIIGFGDITIHGYKLVKPHMVERKGIMLLNFIMNKKIRVCKIFCVNSKIELLYK